MNKKIRMILLIGLVVVILGAIFIFGNLNVTQAEVQNKAKSVIGYIDVMDIFESHPEKVLAEKELNNEVMKLQEQLEDEVKDLSQEKREEILGKYQSQLTEREQELIKGVIDSIDETIREVADELGIKVVLEKKNVIFGGEDLTEQVKERIQQKYSDN